MNKYLRSKLNAWSETTLKSEEGRCVTLYPLLDEHPDLAWKKIKSLYSPYSRATAWTRLVELYSFYYPKKENPFRKWRQDNARQFKHVYTKKTPKISYDEARQKIQTLPRKETREKALQLLNGGLRWSESFTISKAGYVTGKGKKVRKTFVDRVEYSLSYRTFVRDLSTVGLKPHDLRKIRATDLLRRGMSILDVAKVMGWSDINTAQSYIAELEEDKMKEFFTNGS